MASERKMAAYEPESPEEADGKAQADKGEHVGHSGTRQEERCDHRVSRRKCVCSHLAEGIHTHRASSVDQRLDRLLEHLEGQLPHRRRLPIRSRQRVYFLDINDIDWVEAADNYVKVHAHGKGHVVRQTLRQMEESLSPRGFVRIHRSAIVNIARIREIQPWFSGEYAVLLRGGAKLTTGRAYRSRLQELME